jgi:hypothetical protein
MVLGLTLEGFQVLIVTIGCPSFCPRGSWGCYGRCGDDSKKFQPGYHPYLSVKKRSAQIGSMGLRGGPALVSSPRRAHARGKIVTAQTTARGQLIFFNLSCGRASDPAAAPWGFQGFQYRVF